MSTTEFYATKPSLTEARGIPRPPVIANGALDPVSATGPVGSAPPRGRPGRDGVRPSRPPRVPRHLHHAGSGRGVRTPSPALQRREGLRGPAPSGPEGVPARRPPVSRDARRHGPQLRRGARVPRSSRCRHRRAAFGGERPGLHRSRTGCRSGAQRDAQPPPDDHAPRRHRRARVRRLPGWRPSRRGQGPGQRARALVPRLVRPMGPQAPAARAVADLPGRVRPGEHFRAFPLSDWTELDVWQYIEREQISLPSIYFAHRRPIIERDGMLLAVSQWVEPAPGEVVEEATVRFRTVGDATCTGAVRSTATTLDRSSRKWRSRGSLSAAPPGLTIASRRPPWRTGSVRGTSDPWGAPRSPSQ